MWTAQRHKRKEWPDGCTTSANSHDYANLLLRSHCRFLRDEKGTE